MYLHIGADVVINSADVVAVIDLDTAGATKATQDFLRQSEQMGKIVYVGKDIPKSAVIVSSGDCDKVYITSYMPQTLIKRKII